MKLPLRLLFVTLIGVSVAVTGCSRPPAAPPVAAAAPATEPFSFVQITDSHYGTPLHLARTRQAVERINALPMPIACVVHTGDLASDNLFEPGVADAISNEFAKLKAPVIFVAGNHDILQKNFDTTLALYRSHFGAIATRHEFHGVAFLALYTEPLRSAVSVADYDPLTWLAEQLDAHPDQPTLVFHHTPDSPDLYNNQVHRGWPEESHKRWNETLARGRVEAVIAGHFHRDEVRWNEQDIPNYTASSIAGYWGRQGSFRVYTYNGGRLSYHTIYLDDPPAEPK